MAERRKFQIEKSKARDEDPVTLQRKNKGLQLKLDSIRQKKNTIEGDNQRLKSEINQLRRDRMLFDKIYSKLKSDLDSKKDDLKRVVSKTHFAEEFIEQAESKICEQKRQAFQEQRKFEKEFDEVKKSSKLSSVQTSTTIMNIHSSIDLLSPNESNAP